MKFIFIVVVILVIYILWRMYFLRDPKRNIPEGPVVVSPADGFVVYIKRVTAGEIPYAIKKKRKIVLSEVSGVDELKHCSGTLIGIFMTPKSVHRNRVPISGKVLFQKHHKNEMNLSMVRKFVETFMHRQMEEDHPENEYLLINERTTTAIQTEKGTYFVTQIADPWINRIISWVKKGDIVVKGEQYGMIRFGSQCDLLLPDSLGVTLTIKEGQYLYAGESIVGEIQ